MTATAEKIEQGAKRAVGGQWRVFYDGYWIKAYDAPADTLLTKKKLIEALTRRLFNHVEHGVNIPGVRLEEARRAYGLESDPRKARVKAAMLAGALFNRATDVFTKVVEIQALGIEIGPDNDLMRQCGAHLQEALMLGCQVLHRSGEEGIDELWGEPFKAFAFPIEEFYKSRYVKIAQTMRAIDLVTRVLGETLVATPLFADVGPLVADFASAARQKCETLHTDPEIFNVWATFVAAGERLAAFEPALPADAMAAELERSAQGMRLLLQAKEIVFCVTRARVPMPKTTRAFCDRCDGFRAGNVHHDGAVTTLVPHVASGPLAAHAELQAR
ncbi:MAG TPA: hypothetical protein VH560_06785 [Polyangia bacterium]|jgi:hypothetical protein|nr:hypothetical protein [Polyangia bacterium]